MDCTICTSMPVMLRPPRNVICSTCYEGARSVIFFINKQLQTAQGPADQKPNLCKTLENVSKWVRDMKAESEELSEKIRFLSGFSVAFRDQIHTDILLQPGESGPPIPAHKALLAIRSEVFNNILDSDGCKAPATDTVKLPELNHEELESLLEFLYNGDLPEDKMNKHIYSLSLAADKYGISYLQKLYSSKIGYGGEAYIADQKLFEMDRNIDAICSICQLLKIIPNVSGLEKLQSPQILCVHNQRSKLLSM
ncbi:BTB/POZ domain-containing protein At3g56230-like isoform X2 [Pyrus x bretschneideri]|uniref:BTB/POZ domain-containing protein At3g56230-like isoform X2 n=1 Tax=Pyrus x bretschneideri TaxID=225117 RepID=UPI00202E3F0B|nr:BTB/POZ domain-containing protein At3g56230-like isoform X2 [Pyrus x bretschneideri]